MRIGINGLFRGKPTGVANYIIHLVNCLEEIDRSNEYFVFVTESNRGYFNFREGNFHPVMCPQQTEVPVVRRLWEQTFFPCMIHRYGIQVLHCPVNVLPLPSRCRTAVTILDCQYFDASAKHTFFRKAFNSLFMRLSYRRADVVMTISNSMKEEIVRYFGGDGSNVAVTHLGQEFRPVTEWPDPGLRDRLGISRPYLLFVGFPNHRKNLPALIRGLALAQGMLEAPVDLAICGDIRTTIESDLPAVLAAVRQTGMGERVKLIDYLEQDELQALMSHAEGFVFPTLYEGFGLPVVEAMACGTPVLVSDIPVLREVAGDAAVYVDPRDDGSISTGICRLLGDERLRARLRNAGSSRAAEFTWQETARQTLACYRRALTGAR